MSYPVQMINSTCSFLAGLLIVFISIRFFKIDQSRWKLLLLSLPFIKILWDLALRGIPSSSVIHAGINPLTLPPKHQTLTIGAGFSEYGPIFNLVFSSKARDGRIYSSSVADYLFALAHKDLGDHAPHAVLAAILLLSAFFTTRRIWIAAHFELDRRRNRLSDRPLRSIPMGYRRIDVYSSERYRGTPFTGGVLRPFICFPQETFALMDRAEIEAVIQHETAHVRHLDLPVNLMIRSLGDFFWFVPGYRYLSQKIDRLREVLADQSAVRAGASPEHLASALIKLKEMPADDRHAVLHSAFFREKSLLKARITNLLGQSEAEAKPRWGWNYLPVRVLVSAWTAGAVMLATFGGNHEVKVQEFPAWFENFLKSLGV